MGVFEGFWPPWGRRLGLVGGSAMVIAKLQVKLHTLIRICNYDHEIPDPDMKSKA